MSKVRKALSRNKNNNSKKKQRKILTPEGIELSIVLASRGDRASAVVIDFLIISLLVVGVSLIAMLLGSLFGFSSAGIFFLLSYFFLRSFYFIFFELKWQGQTPGKRFLGIRAIKRSGGRLDAGSIFARNLMREVEIFLPISLLFSSTAMGFSGWVNFFTFLWCIIMIFMPFFNKDNMRIGDLVGGTWVISIPKASLLDEVGQHIQKGADDENAAPEIHFTKKQLSIYGIYELQTLENILRNEKEVLHGTIADKIKKKIGWDDDNYYGKPTAFLQAFYSAMRRHHEGEILMGRRKQDKFSGTPKAEKPKPLKNILKDR